MHEMFIAFIVLCTSPGCDTDKRMYADKATLTLELCRQHGYGWAMQMKALTDKDYAFGCKRFDYKPREIPPS